MSDQPFMRAYSETLVLAEHLGVYAAAQPCSGIKTVMPRAFSPGSGTASPVVMGHLKSVA